MCHYPIIIPTLNRYEHLRRCISSLSRNTGADQTELIIGLDTPPSEKYVEGYKLIKQYVTSISGFKSVTILETDVNLGPQGNEDRLVEHVKKLGYDAFILTEDDNEFSPNFLEFVNWGLERFKNDPNIIAISGYNELPVDFVQDNVFVSTWYSGWGVGKWIDKWKELENKVCNPEYCKKFIANCPLSIVFSRDVWIPSSMIQSIRSGVHHGDGLPYRNDVRKLYTVHPKLSMVRNWGADGSGQHGSDKQRQEKQESCMITKDLFFIPPSTDIAPSEKIEQVESKHFKANPIWRLYRICDFLTYRFTGHSASGIYVFYRKYIRKWLKKH